IEQRIAAFAPRKSKGISYRESGTGQALVFLHGIGSSSASWLFQLEKLAGYRLIAWDAPGYGESDCLPGETPRAADYAQALHEFLDRLLLKDVVLVGNSLGCLMAASYAAAHGERVRSMILLSPAGGHGSAPDREQRLAERLKQLEELGPEGLAEKRSPTIVGKQSPRIALELVQWSQRRIRPQGYRQAIHCLAQGRLADDAPRFTKKVLVVCGSEDIVTPEASCKAIANAFPRAEYRTLQGLGHAPHAEAPHLVNDLVRGFVPR
ncbi:MAG TPA: alpha/beta hydrolase, partial [Burkholderiales bacterium]